MTIVKLHHASFTVTDLDRTVDFYQRLLGFELVSHKHRDAPQLGTALLGPGISREQEDADIRLVHMELSGTGGEFIQYRDPGSEPYHGDPSGAGSGHLAIAVRDIEAERERLIAAGVEFHSPVRVIHDPGSPVWKWCYLRDPDGIVVELVEVGPPAGC